MQVSVIDVGFYRTRFLPRTNFLGVSIIDHDALCSIGLHDHGVCITRLELLLEIGDELFVGREFLLDCLEMLLLLRI